MFWICSFLLNENIAPVCYIVFATGFHHVVAINQIRKEIFLFFDNFLQTLYLFCCKI